MLEQLARDVGSMVVLFYEQSHRRIQPFLPRTSLSHMLQYCSMPTVGNQRWYSTLFCSFNGVPPHYAVKAAYSGTAIYDETAFEPFSLPTIYVVLRYNFDRWKIFVHKYRLLINSQGLLDGIVMFG